MRRTVLVKTNNLSSKRLSRIIDEIKKERMQRKRVGINFIIEKATPHDILKTFKKAQKSRIYSVSTPQGIKIVREKKIVEKSEKIKFKEILREHGKQASYVLVEKSDGSPQLFIKGHLYPRIPRKKV